MKNKHTTEKRLPVGICDYCEEPFPSGVPQYTTRGAPRLRCSVECRNRANAKKSVPAQRQRQLRRVHASTWVDPNPVTHEAATARGKDACAQALG